MERYHDQIPKHIADFGGLRIYDEGTGFVLPRVRTLFDSCPPERLADVCGRAVPYVIGRLDWMGVALPRCMTALDGDRVVGAAWAQPVRRREDGAEGGNLSFALTEGYEGQGVAAVLASIACAHYLLENRAAEFMNVQSEAGNATAHRLAERLGMVRRPEFDRTASEPFADRLYVTYRAHASAVSSRCLDIIQDLLAAPVNACETATTVDAPRA